MDFNKILDMIDSYEYVMVVNMTFKINNRFIILAFIIKIEVF